MTRQDYLQRKGELATQADGILTKVREEGRYDMRADESTQFDAIHADIEKINGILSRMDKLEAISSPEERQTTPNPISSQTKPTSSSTATRVADAGEALRAWLLPERARTPELRAAAQRAGVALDSSEFTFKLAPVPMRSSLAQNGLPKAPDADEIRGWRQANELRAPMGTTSGAVGGYSVPDAAMQAIEIALLAFGGMRQVASVIRTDGGSALPIPTSNDTSNKGAILTENTQVSEVDVTMGQLVLDAYMYSSKSVLVSLQLLQDSAVNVPEMIGRMLGERIGRIQNDHFTTGTGSSQPNGIVTAATDSTVTAASATLYTYDELVNVLHAVDPAYRANARWMFADSTLKNLKKIKVLQYSGDTVGVPLWVPGLTAGVPDTIMGFPYVINQSMAAPASAAKTVVFGDLSKYIIRDVRDITLLRLNERYADYHQVGFLAFARSDGDLLDAGTHPVVWADHT